MIDGAVIDGTAIDWGAAQRITVIGCSGAGKSTLSRALAAATGLPIVHLDRAYWRAGWVQPDDADWTITHAALVAGDHWIIDGHFRSTLPVRCARADAIVFLDLPTRSCLWGVAKRIATTWSRTRSDMTRGCDEHLDWGFLQFVATFRRRKRPAIVRLLARHDDRVVRCTTHAQADALAAAVVTARASFPAPS